MNPILQPLSFPDNSTQENVEETNNSICECLLCSDAFDLKTDGNDKLLAHLLIKHKLVIGDLKEIADFQRFEQVSMFNFRVTALIDGGFLLSPGTSATGKGNSKTRI